MSNAQQCLISQDKGKLQIPYADYLALMEKVREGQQIFQTKQQVLTDLKDFLGGESEPVAAPAVEEKKQPEAPKAAQPTPEPEKVSVEFDAEDKAAKKTEQAAEKPAPQQPNNAPQARKTVESTDVPPIKKDISEHFNKQDESGRLFSVFKQYYTCLNDTCGGIVRVTMKDGFCSLWNYDEWEEFAFIDIFEGHLRVAVDPRYTDALKSLNFCEVPRLLSSRRNLVCVKVDDLNNTMLKALVTAFEEVGLATS